MRVLVLSDVHANLEALEAVLEDAGEFDSVWFLGDAVGYGPEPNACVERLMALEPTYWLAGNHDWAALGKLDVAEFNNDARIAAEWTAGQLNEAVRTLLARVEPLLEVPGDTYTLSHGSPRHPIWEYVLDVGTAAENFDHFDSRVCMFGHTHVPVLFEQAVDGVLRLPVILGEPHDPGGARLLVNPGSVGQPRDGDPRASYLLLDLETGQLSYQRVEYNIAAVQKKILDARLPSRLAARLEYGW